MHIQYLMKSTVQAEGFLACHAACGTSVVQRGAKSVTRASQSGRGGRISRARWCGRSQAADSLENRDATAWLREALEADANLYHGTVKRPLAQTSTKKHS